MHPLKKLYELGQSPWYDNIDRKLLKSGELDRLIRDFGIKGLTTNPSIFEKAISKSSEYDGQIRELAKQGRGLYEIYDELTAADVGLAADLLKETYKETNGRDGYVSIEVLPEYAHLSQDTIDYARRIFKTIGRPNIMVKVPGTSESAPAIKTLISEGINVNVTLLFSTQHYQQVAQAYIDGLKERLRNGEDLRNVASVASVFVSRIDTRMDKLLAEHPDHHRYGLNDLCGCLAVANSKMIYQLFKKIFSPDNFGYLQDKGAKVQRVLWASTSTKNPAYSDIKYVQELVGKDTINTLPHETVLAFADHGSPQPCLEDNLEQERKRIEDCRKLGVDLIKVCQEIQDAGLRAFQDSFDQVIGAIQKKAEG
jgi:transaldolase